MAPSEFSEPTSRVLEAVLRRAGAVFVQRYVHQVVVSYGSSAGELAACVCAAGMADTSELVKLELTGRPAAMRELVRQATGEAAAPGGCLLAGGAWWCGAAADRVIVLSEPRCGARLRGHLAGRAARLGCDLRDRTSEWAAITVLGLATNRVLASLGVFGASSDPHAVAPFTSCPLAGAETLWLLESAHRAVALVRAEDADLAWHAIEHAGRPQHICCVGQDAVDRYTLLERHAA